MYSPTVVGGIPYFTTMKPSRIQNSSQSSKGVGPVKGVSASYARKMTVTAPTISQKGKSFRVRHKELVISSVAGATSFTVQNTLNLNPGLSATFPWLAPQAQQYEQYVVHKLDLLWVALAPTSTQGVAIISPDYDSADPTPTTEVQICDNEDTVEEDCWSDFRCVLNPESMMGGVKRKFIRPCNVAGDIKTFDMGKVFVAVNNQTGTTAVGKVWIEYDFEFFVPQNSPSPATTPQQSSLFTLNSSEAFTTGVAGPIQYDTLVYDPLGVGAAAAGVFTPAAGSYAIWMSSTCSDTANENFTSDVSFFKNGTALSKVIRSLVVTPGAGITAYHNQTLVGIIPFNGTDTFQVQLTLTGAAGTLNAVGGMCQLVFRLA